MTQKRLMGGSVTSAQVISLSNELIETVERGGEVERLQLSQERRNIMNPLTMAGLAITSRFTVMVNGQVETQWIVKKTVY